MMLCYVRLDLNDPAEKGLLYYQVLCDLRSDRFPVTDMEVVCIPLVNHCTLVRLGRDMLGI